MKNKNLLILTTSLVFLGACASTDNNGSHWNCEAKGLNNFSYDGSSKAYIHLKGFSRGSHYPVTMSDNGTQANGVTGNGTPFTCKKTIQ